MLGLIGDQKYQRIGGSASLTRIAKTIRHLPGDPPAWLLRMATLAVAVGNLHAKNLAILHPLGGDPTPAPALRRGAVGPPPERRRAGASRRRRIPTRSHHGSAPHRRGRLVGVRGGLARRVVAATCERIRDFAGDNNPHPLAHPLLTTAIVAFCERLLAGRPAGVTP